PIALCVRPSLPSPSSLSFFSPLLLRPPCSTLFPYTTLFRSHLDLSHVPQCLHFSHPIHSLGTVLPILQPFDFCRNYQYIGNKLPDRKSTRLNSSHVSISYAVFCLKKKKKHNDNNGRYHIDDS